MSSYKEREREKKKEREKEKQSLTKLKNSKQGATCNSKGFALGLKFTMTKGKQFCSSLWTKPNFFKPLISTKKLP